MAFHWNDWQRTCHWGCRLGNRLSAILLLLFPGMVFAESDSDFFEKRIRPLLIEKCEGCHSSAKGKTSGRLALDTATGWNRGGDSGTAIKPGKPEDSLLIKAVKYLDDGPQMPPKDKGGKLTDAQIADLVEWVRRGAHDPRSAVARIGGMNADEARKWWSFQPVRTVTPPAAADQPIDAFLQVGRMAARVTPLGPADKRTLIRRATFDLTGLPPTPDEIHSFLADESPEAFSRLVDRLLESPAYGERWGRNWLDVARYADTAGDGADYPVREAGKYRDWVIRAFNKDQPFDEFLREQIAGDVIARSGPPELYADRVTATGFLAIGKRYGYSPSPDYQHLDFADVIDSVGRSVLGLSLGCARCHDHKYDPVTTEDYYALYGIMQSTKWAFPGGEEHKQPANFPPLVLPEEATRREQAKAAELARIDGAISKLKSERATLDGKSFAGGVDLALEGQPFDKPPAAPWLSAGPNSVIADAQSPFTHIHPTGTRGVRLGTGLKTDGVRYVFENGLRATKGKQMHFTVDFRTVSPTDKTGAYRFYLGRGVIASLAVEFSITATEFAIKNGAKWDVIRKPALGEWQTLRITIDPDKRTYSGVVGTIKDLTAFQDIAVAPGWDGILDTFICDGFGHLEGPASVRDLDNVGLLETPFAAPGTGPVAPFTPPADAAERLKAVDGELAALNQQRATVAASVPYEVVYGVSEGTPQNAKVQKRGEPDKLGDEVPRRFLQILGGDPLPPGTTGSGRLELANWLTRPDNPLTARVFVNRVWQWHFGRGLVPTSSDFGVRGDRPSHPELLDWLTSQFVASGWKVKSLHRLIMRTQAYQLASDDDSANLPIDPENRWLWRYSRRALDAESIRDAMLAVSGKLDRSAAPPHPFPPTATWGFTIHRPFHAVYDSNYRSVYLMVQRNRRHPFLALFDAADPNQSVAERLPTTTPTQSLFLMNAPFVHEQSEAFARRILTVRADDEGRVRYALEAACGRVASPDEIASAKVFLNDYRQKLNGRSPAVTEPDVAAWSALARVLMTSNSFLYVD
ncbi:MAG: PSD1 and planctomycete cytochrome C domain-containing protein [Planctomycetaceae bacterium]